MANVETGTVQMITALRDGLHGLHLARMALVAESKALRLAGRKAEREKVWARVEEITAQIEVTTRELAEHMLRAEDSAARWVELMPCPFCGGLGPARKARHEMPAKEKPMSEKQTAVDCWNTRTAYMPDDRRSGE